MAEIKPTIIIKKIKKGGHGHHGGAWKVAYADFVTAMMAFFLLMWLLNATNEEQKQGLADYFSPTIGLRDALGIGFKGGEGDAKTGNKKNPKGQVNPTVGAPDRGPVPEVRDDEKQSMIESDGESSLFEKAADALQKAMHDDAALAELTENVMVKQTPEGLKIEVMDLDKQPMFMPGTAELSPAGRKLLSKMSQVIQLMPNFISITGHTDATAFSPSPNYTNWELSVDRANSARRFLMTTNLEPQRVEKIIGVADREPLDGEDPRSTRNRRITIVLLKGTHLQDVGASTAPAPRDLLSVPKAPDISPKDPAAPAANKKPESPAPQTPSPLNAVPTPAPTVGEVQ